VPLEALSISASPKIDEILTLDGPIGQRSRCSKLNFPVGTAGLPDFSGCVIPKPEKMYQINTKCTKWS
jgi:hypothetical protein